MSPRAPAYLLVLVLAGGLPAVAFGQRAGPDGGQTQVDAPGGGPPLRAELLRTARRARAGEFHEPTRGLIESALLALETSLAPKKVASGYGGFAPFSTGVPNGHGLEVGFGYHRTGLGVPYPKWNTPDRVDIEALAGYSLRGFRRIQAAGSWNNIGGSRFAVRGQGQLYDWPGRDFFGRGPDSTESDRAEYSMAGNEIGAEALFRVGERAAVGLGLYRVRVETDPREDEDAPSVDERFPAADLPGFGLDRTFRRLDVFAEVDRRDSPGFPRSGGRYAFRFSDYSGRSSDAGSFRRYEVEAQQYLPLPRDRRVLALRAYSVFTDPVEGAEVPFYFWPVLGDGTRMRGFAAERFSDRNLVLMSAEYRWEVWWLLDATLFVDLGNVTEHSRDLFDDLKASYGFGLRAHGRDKLGVGADFAWGGEGFRVHALLTYPFRVGGVIR